MYSQSCFNLIFQCQFQLDCQNSSSQLYSIYSFINIKYQDLNLSVNQLKMEKDQTHPYANLQYRIPFQEVQKWKSFIDQYGFVVIKNYIAQQDAVKYVDQLWGVMQKLSQGRLSRKDKQTWKSQKNYPPIPRGGMIQYIGHTKAQWQLRKSAKPLFQKLWNTAQVKSSFDGFCFMNGELDYKVKQENAGLHVDQHPTNTKLWSYQGIQTLTDALQDGGGFVCVPKSHKYFAEYFKQKDLANHKGSYNIPEQDKYLENIEHYIKINSKAGDFILFDSRTIHASTLPRTKTLRIVTYICMIPAQLVDKQTLQLRMMAFTNRKTSTHYPGKGFRTFSQLPRCKNKQILQKLIQEVNNSFEIEKDEKIMDLI